MSQPDLARASGTSPQYVSLVERGADPRTGKPPRVSEEVLRAWAKALGKTASERDEITVDLLQTAGYATTATLEKGTALSEGGTTDALARAVAIEVQRTLRDILATDSRLRRVSLVPHDLRYVPAGTIAPMAEIFTDLHTAAPDRYVAITVSGTCMEPAIRDGATVIIDTQREPRIRDVVVFDTDGDWAIKRLRAMGENTWLLVPDHTDFPPVEIDPSKAFVVGVVIQVTYGKP